MSELMGISSREGDEPFIELFSDCKSLSCIKVFLSMICVPQMLAVKAQGGKEKLDKALFVEMICVVQICSLLGEERRRELKGRKGLKNLQKKKLPGTKKTTTK